MDKVDRPYINKMKGKKINLNKNNISNSYNNNYKIKQIKKIKYSNIK